MDLSNVALKCILSCELLSTQCTLHHLVLTMLLDDVPSQDSHRELLIAQLAGHGLSMFRPNVLLNIFNGLLANVAAFLLISSKGCHF